MSNQECRSVSGGEEAMSMSVYALNNHGCLALEAHSRGADK